MIDFDTQGLRRMGADLTAVTRSTASAAYDAVSESATDLRDTWRRNAKQTSGKTARRYPDTITAWPRLGAGKVEFEVYPDERVNGQANLGAVLEYGTSTSPAHLDGQQAMVEVAPRMERRVEAAVFGLFGLGR